jgi:hypothetical protein
MLFSEKDDVGHEKCQSDDGSSENHRCNALEVKSWNSCKFPNFLLLFIRIPVTVVETPTGTYSRCLSLPATGTIRHTLQGHQNRPAVLSADLKEYATGLVIWGLVSMRACGAADATS